jgi:hypothetical protein
LYRIQAYKIHEEFAALFFGPIGYCTASSYNVVVAARKPFTVMKPCGAGGHLTHGGQ